MKDSLSTVLVTQPGREALFQKATNAVIESLLLYEELSVVLVLNGCTPESLHCARELQSRFSERIQLILFDENSSLPGRTWGALIKLKLGWVHFPGDDDLVVPSTYQAFFELEDKGRFGAIAFNAECIDLQDHSLGRKLRPPISDSHLTSIDELFSAFHQPPFVWPALILDFSLVPTPVFQSRYVFDWWVSLQLIYQKRWIKIDQTLVKYRIHENQESQLMPDTRKRFEAMLMISDFMDHVKFEDKMAPFKQRQKDSVFKDLDVPIYGDHLFGGFILWRILSLSNPDIRKWSSRIDYEILEWGRQLGVPLVTDEIPYRDNPRTDDAPVLTNFCVEVDKNCCNTVKELSREFLSDSGERLGALKCLHSNDAKASVRNRIIDCNRLSALSDRRQRVAYLMKFILVSSSLARGGISLSPREQKLVQLFRRFKVGLRAVRRLLNS